MNRPAIYTCSILISLMSMVFIGCNNKSQQESSVSKEDYTIWADTIIYDVLISNPDTIDEWETAKTKYVNQIKMVDDFFNMVYSGKKQAYHYYTNKPLSIEDIRGLEEREDFSRDKVGKLQFTETWLYDNNAQMVKKKVIKVLLAYELYDDSGNLRGYKAGFYLKDF